MKAMIFAAGLGMRLQSLTSGTPKALVPVAGVPLLEHCLRTLQQQGFDQVVLNVHHYADQIESYLKKRPQGCQQVLISDERTCLLETGGGLKKAASLLLNGFDHSDEQEDVLIHNVDILSNIDLSRMMRLHKQCSADATLAVSKRNSSRLLYFDAELNLRGWKNAKTGEQKPLPFNENEYISMAFSGIHIVSAQVLQDLQSWPERFPIMDYYLGSLDKRHFHAYTQADMKVLDVGKPEAVEKADRFIHEMNIN